MKLTVDRIGTLIWILIYAGMLVLAVGLALRDVHGLLAGTVSLLGSLAAAAGVVLIWVRARMVRTQTRDRNPPATRD